MRVAYNMAAFAVFFFGATYASVPLYKVFCQVTGFGGTTQRLDLSKASGIKPLTNGRVIKVDFTCSVHRCVRAKTRELPHLAS